MIPREVQIRELERIAGGLEQLHSKWKPHPAQITVGRALLYEGSRNIMAVCGRNFGKSELMGYLLWRWAWTYPGSENYYFAPFMKQAREIMWASKRIQSFGPWDWIESINETEMRIRFNNGSFIKLEGSDNDQALRGIKPRGVIIYDEYKDFRPEFHDAFDPNRAAFDAPLLVIGTPPEFENHFNKMEADFSADPKKRFFRFPTEANPHIPRDWLEAKKRELYAKGEGDKWEREYMALNVRGGASRIFPMLDPAVHIHAHNSLINRIRKDRKKLEWFIWADPAGASCFAVLFVAINPYTREIFVLDEIYETSQAEMTVVKIGNRLLSMADELHDDRDAFRKGYDEAETWFANEMLAHFGLHFEPTQKAKSDKMTGLSLIKDTLLANKLFISDRCTKLFWEMDQYRKDSSGKIPKLNDHAIDCLRYILQAAHYGLHESDEINPEKDESFRGARITDDFPNFQETGEPLEDWSDDYDF